MLVIPARGCGSTTAYLGLAVPRWDASKCSSTQGRQRLCYCVIVVVSACYDLMCFHAKISFPCGEGLGSVATHQSKGTATGDTVSHLIPNKTLQEASQILAPRAYHTNIRPSLPAFMVHHTSACSRLRWCASGATRLTSAELVEVLQEQSHLFDMALKSAARFPASLK